MGKIMAMMSPQSQLRVKHPADSPRRTHIGWETRHEPHGSHSVLPTAEAASRLHSLLCLEEYLVGKEGKGYICS